MTPDHLPPLLASELNRQYDIIRSPASSDTSAPRWAKSSGC